MPSFPLPLSGTFVCRRYTAFFLAGLLFLSACATPPTSPKELPVSEQKVLIRVLDSRDHPIAGAKITFTPQAGRPRTPGPYLTDELGQLAIYWQPQAIDETKGTHIGDQIITFATRMRYLVEAKGFIPVSGVMQGRDSSRRVFSPQLQSLNRQADMRPLVELVVLRSQRDLLGGDLAPRPLNDPLIVRCLAFAQSLKPVAAQLGTDFAWPAFVLKGASLSLHFAWKGAAWGGLEPAPLTAKVVVSAGLPLALACGEELVPLTGVKELTLKFFSEILPPGDPHAMPERAAVILSAPVEAYQKLAQGKMTPDQFLLKHPPFLQKDQAPR